MAKSFFDTISVSFCDVIHLHSIDIPKVSYPSFAPSSVGPLRADSRHLTFSLALLSS